TLSGVPAPRSSRRAGRATSGKRPISSPSNIHPSRAARRASLRPRVETEAVIGGPSGAGTGGVATGVVAVIWPRFPSIRNRSHEPPMRRAVLLSLSFVPLLGGCHALVRDAEVI